MLSFILKNKELILFLISISGFSLSLYNFFNDRKRLTLSYTLLADQKSKRLIMTGILSNPSKTPNSIVMSSFYLNGNRIETSRYHDGGFDMGSFHRSSRLHPIEFAKALPGGSAIAFQEILKIESITPNDKLVFHMQTANYSKKYGLKLKDSF
jgi:hypothetical protein